MADNPFSVDVPSLVPALLLGQQAYKQGQDANKAQALTDARSQAMQAYQGGDPKTALSTLLGVGDYQGANAIGTQIQNDWTRQHTATTDARAASNDAFSHSIQTQQLALSKRAADRADEDKFSLQQVTDPTTGATSIIRVNTKGPEGLVPTGIAPSTPNNPFTSGPKLNTDQSKSATMVDRMNDANGIITKNESINDGMGKPLGLAQAIPFVRDSALFNVVASPERQQVVQAQRNFVNAILRVESGAAISQSEFENAQRQYFPQVGDSPEVLKQKRQNRVTAMQGMAREAGPNYKPPQDLINAAGAAPGSSQGKSGDAIYAAARDAIAKGADRNKVLERLQQNGIDPSGL